MSSNCTCDFHILLLLDENITVNSSSFATWLLAGPVVKLLMFNIRVRVQFACWSWADSVNADSGTTAALAEAVVRFIAAENSLCLIFAAAAAAEFIR